MKQITQTQSSGEVRVCDTPAPALRPGGVLVRTAYSLVSAGTERAKVRLAKQSLIGKAKARPDQVRQVLRALREQGIQDTYRRVTNRLTALEPLGYSCSGIVIRAANDVRDLAAGELVACAGGGYANHAEVNFIPVNLCARIPGGRAGTPKTLLEGAAFGTVAAIAMQGVRQAELRVGEIAVVIGLGLIGLLTVQIAKASGCIVIGIEPDENRRALAAACGCDAVAQSPRELHSLVLQHSDGFGADAVLVTAASSSSEPVEIAARIARDRGRVVVVGAVRLDIPRQPFYDKELELRLSRSYGPGRYDPEYEERGHDYPIGYVRWTEKRNIQSFLRLLADGAIDVRQLITHCFPIAEAERAYELITNNQEPYLGVIIDYGTAATEPQPECPRPQLIELVSRAATAARPMAAAGREIVRIGVIGAGSFAQNVLLPAIKSDSGIELRTVVTTSGLGAKSVARRFGFANAGSDPAEVFDDPNVDAVIIATRHDSHASLAAEALRKGKAVFVEKPLAIDEAGLIEVEAARAEAATDIMVGFNRRFAPATVAAKQWLSGVAEPKMLSCRVNAGVVPRTHWIHDPRIGGGRMIGEGCHFLDLLGFLAGSTPVDVEATAMPDCGRYSRDNVVVRVRYADGSIATMTYVANGAPTLAKEYVEVFAGGRAAIIDDFRRLTLAGPDKQERHGGRFTKQDKGHQAEVAAFLAAIRRGAPSPIAFHELVTTTRLTLQTMEALRS